MICETCHGQGKRLNPASLCEPSSLFITANHYSGGHVANPDNLPLLVPCDECQGSGVAHCCEGLRAQPGEDR